MEVNMFTLQGRIQVTNYSPFRGLKGTIQGIDKINDPLDGSPCFYLVALEGADFPEPIWFEHDEITSIDATIYSSSVSR